MAGQRNHDYHVVGPSPWPLLAGVSAFVICTGGILWMHDVTYWVFVVGMMLTLYCMYGWWSDVIKESHEGDHTPVVQIGLRYGVIMFIASEVMFFVAWFWSFFKHAIFPAGGVWPPEGIQTFDPWHLPLINTLILLTSGATLTWAHQALLENDRKSLVNALVLTIVLGVVFSITQAYEYSHAAFGFSGSIYAANFYMATGFHGVHVIIGTIFIAICLVRVLKGHFTAERHIGFESAAWYWHFVDVVWLFLFAVIYVWGQ